MIQASHRRSLHPKVARGSESDYVIGAWSTIHGGAHRSCFTGVFAPLLVISLHALWPPRLLQRSLAFSERTLDASRQSQQTSSVRGGNKAAVLPSTNIPTSNMD